MSKVEVELEKWGRFCELWHSWNERKREAHKTDIACPTVREILERIAQEAMLQVEVIFHKEFRAYRKQRELIRKSKPLTIEG